MVSNTNCTYKLGRKQGKVLTDRKIEKRTRKEDEIGCVKSDGPLGS